jgi:hypothetical protein
MLKTLKSNLLDFMAFLFIFLRFPHASFSIISRTQIPLKPVTLKSGLSALPGQFVLPAQQPQLTFQAL